MLERKLHYLRYTLNNYNNNNDDDGGDDGDDNGQW